MILTRLSQYLRLNGRASLDDMAIALDASPDALRAMLTTLQRKGRVRRLPPPKPACGTSCNGCGQARVEMYAWSRDATPPTPETQI